MGNWSAQPCTLQTFSERISLLYPCACRVARRWHSIIFVPASPSIFFAIELLARGPIEFPRYRHPLLEKTSELCLNSGVCIFREQNFVLQYGASWCSIISRCWISFPSARIMAFSWRSVIFQLLSVTQLGSCMAGRWGGEAECLALRYVHHFQISRCCLRLLLLFQCCTRWELAEHLYSTIWCEC